MTTTSERSNWRKKLESGLTGLVGEMNSTYKLGTQEQGRQREAADTRLVEELVRLASEIAEGVKCAEMYKSAGLGDIGYAGSFHAGTEGLERTMSHCKCVQHPA